MYESCKCCVGNAQNLYNTTHFEVSRRRGGIAHARRATASMTSEVHKVPSMSMLCQRCFVHVALKLQKGVPRKNVL